MNKEKPCNTTLRLGIEVEVTREKQLKQSKRELCLDLSLPIHPNIEGSDHEDHDHTLDDEKDDQDSYSSRITDDHEKEEARRSAKRSDFSNNDLYLDNSGGSRKKLKLSAEQITLLEASFKIHSTLNTGQKQELAKKLHLLPRQIEVWFQNRRARTKLKHIEQECVFLRKCCAALSDENCRLKKELREARRGSLKFDHTQQRQPQPQPPQHPPPFYIGCQTTTETRHTCM